MTESDQSILARFNKQSDEANANILPSDVCGYCSSANTATPVRRYRYSEHTCGEHPGWGPPTCDQCWYLMCDACANTPASAGEDPSDVFHMRLSAGPQKDWIGVCYLVNTVVREIRLLRAVLKSK